MNNMSMKSKYSRHWLPAEPLIGSHLVEELLKEGLEVISIDNYFAGKKRKTWLNFTAVPASEK